MPRHCHRIRENRGTEAAGSWIFWDTESIPDDLGETAEVIRHRLRLGVAVHCRLCGGQVLSETWLTFKTAAEFWAWVLGRLNRRRPTWIVSHNLSFDFPISGGFQFLEQYGLDQWRLILGPPVTIMRGRPGGCSVNVVDGLNWLRASIEQLGEWLGVPKLPLPAWEAPDSDWFDRCRRDVEILRDAVLHVVGLHYSHDLGVMGRTIAQNALHAYRHLTKAPKPLIHSDENVSRCERRAYFGGRVECNYVGRFAGEVHQLDVNSLYPSIMRELPLPRRLISTTDNPALSWLAERLELYDGVASVLIDSSSASYPWRPPRLTHFEKRHSAAYRVATDAYDEGRPVYPLGVYRTWLAGEELRRAVRRGHVLGCRWVAFYERAVLFREYVDWWYGFRVAAKQDGRGLDAMLAKGYLTSLAGIWAKRVPKYVAAPDQIPPEPWAVWTERDLIAQVTRRFRAIGNVPQEEIEQDEPPDSFPAISACITAAARERLRDLQALAGPRDWLYEDTDSLMVTTAGLERLQAAGVVDEYGLGRMRLEASSNEVYIRGVKDYQLGEKTVLKGIRRDATLLGDGRYCMWQWSGLKHQLAAKGEPIVRQFKRRVAATHRYTKGHVGPDGWTVPYNLMEHPDFDW